MSKRSSSLGLALSLAGFLFAPTALADSRRISVTQPPPPLAPAARSEAVKSALHLTVNPLIVPKLILTPVKLLGFGGYLELHKVLSIVGKENVGAMFDAGGDVTAHLTALAPDKLYVLDLSLDSYQDAHFHFVCDDTDVLLPMQSKHVLFAFKAPHDGEQNCVIKGNLFGFSFYQLELSAVN